MFLDMQLTENKNSSGIGDFFSLERRRKPLISLFIILFAVVLWRNAWLSDDAYITFRTVDNFFNGYGLTWNTAERVQTYTHPLWMFLFMAFRFFTRETFYTGIFLSAGISLGAVILFAFGIARNTRTALLGTGMLLFSKAFIDYSSSGLENPLTHLLLLFFLYLYLNSKISIKTLLFLSLVAALGMLNRMDTALLYLPSLVYVFIKTADRRRIYAVALGCVPLLIWEAFSFFYYGFLFPNTAYAKLNTGIDSYSLIVQGCRYLLESVEMDHLTVFLIAAATVVTLVKKDKKLIPVVLGVVLYTLYVVRIGGDFMSGRFLAAPLLCSVAVLSRFDRLFSDNIRYAAAWFLVLALGFSSPQPPILSDETYGKDYDLEEAEKWEGIANERAFYYQTTGLLKAKSGIQMPTGAMADKGRELRKKGERFTILKAIGMVSYFGGPRLHVLDMLALTDPLLARLHVQDKEKWRIGHFERRIPDGYIKTLDTGENFITDKDLAAYYDKLKLVTRGELFSPDRLNELVKFIIGENKRLIERFMKRQMLVSIDGMYFDSNSSAFSYIKQCLNYDSRDLPDSAMAVFFKMHHQGLEVSEEEYFYWGLAMKPYHKKMVKRRVITNVLTASNVMFLLRYYTILQDSEQLVNVYQNLSAWRIKCQGWRFLADYITTFNHQSLIRMGAEKIFRDTDNPGLMAQVYMNLLMFYDSAGYPDSASAIFVKIKENALQLGDEFLEEWLKVMESMKEKYSGSMQKEPQNAAYLSFFLRYFLIKQDSQELKNIINQILKGRFEPADWLQLLEMTAAIDRSDWFSKIQERAVSQYPELKDYHLPK
ncbi:MAG TPA: glycosyltransferase family 39 protein [archaeon]|nr:glycosyltransferase family 39 protein [archaeon]